MNMQTTIQAPPNRLPSFAHALSAYDEARAAALAEPTDDMAQMRWGMAADLVIDAQPRTIEDIAAKLEVMLAEGGSGAPCSAGCSATSGCRRQPMLEGQAFPVGARRAAIAELLGHCDRDEIESAVDLLMALLDIRAGDSDFEPNGDELDGNGSEDDFMFHGHHGPGCPISDSGEPDDEPEEDDSSRDVAWLERIDQARAPHSRSRADQREDDGGGRAIGTIEDAEEDDVDCCEAADDNLGSLHGLGSPTSTARMFGLPGMADRKAGDPADAEPSLGSVESERQGGWGNSRTDDFEPWRVPATLNPPLASNEGVLG